MFELSHVEIFNISKTRRAVRFVAEHAKIRLIISRYDSLTPSAFHLLITCVGANHPLTCLVLIRLLESFNTLDLHAKSKSLLGTSQPHHMLCEILGDIYLELGEALHNLDLDAFMGLILSSGHLLTAQLTLDLHFRTFPLDVLEQLFSCHMLELFLITNVATEFRTFIHSMLLKF